MELNQVSSVRILQFKCRVHQVCFVVAPFPVFLSPFFLVGTLCPDNSSSSSACSVGNYCPDFVNQLNCSLGTLCNQQNLSSPLPCPAGYYCPSPLAKLQCSLVCLYSLFPFLPIHPSNQQLPTTGQFLWTEPKCRDSVSSRLLLLLARVEAELCHGLAVSWEQHLRRTLSIRLLLSEHHNGGDMPSHQLLPRWFSFANSLFPRNVLQHFWPGGMLSVCSWKCSASCSFQQLLTV